MDLSPSRRFSISRFIGAFICARVHKRMICRLGTHHYGLRGYIIAPPLRPRLEPPRPPFDPVLAVCPALSRGQAPCGFPSGTTGTTGVSPVDTLGQRASRPLIHTTGCFSLRRLHILPKMSRTSPFQRSLPTRFIRPGSGSLPRRQPGTGPSGSWVRAN